MAYVEEFSDQLNGYENVERFGEDSSKIRSLAVDLKGNVTDILCCDYSDKQFLVITQFQKIGSLILVNKGTTRTLNGISEVYDVKTISGLDSEEYHLATRYIAQQLQINKPVLFGICLKDHSLETLKSIVKVIKDNSIL